jgi:acylphosphatase
VISEVVGRRLTIRGRVQGVFFRSGVRREADSRHVSGWAANCPDGSVEVVLEGAAGDVEDVVSYCAHGPRGAQVADVQVRECTPRGVRGFEIR